MVAVVHAPQRTPRRSRLVAVPPAELIELGKPVRGRRGDRTTHQLRAALDTRLRDLLARDPGTRVGADPEELHQMRSAVRRMRAALKAARPLLDQRWADELRAELSWLGRALGPVRDADVLIERLRGRAATFDQTSRDGAESLLEGLVRERENARGEMLTALGGDRYIALLNALASAVSAPLPGASGRRGGAARRELVDLVRAEFRRLSKAADQVGDNPPDAVLHALRIKVKRLRYTGELALAAGKKPVRKLVRATVALQDVLGEHQDACVAQERVLRLLDSLGDVVDLDVVFAAGRLVEREEVSRLETRQSWHAAWAEVRRRAEALSPAA